MKCNHCGHATLTYYNHTLYVCSKCGRFTKQNSNKHEPKWADTGWVILILIAAYMILRY